MSQTEWELWNAEELAIALEGFSIPPRADRDIVQPGDIVKLVFGINDPGEVTAERLWVIVDGMDSVGFQGVLDTDPAYLTTLNAGDTIEFGPEHIIEIFNEDDYADAGGGCGGNCNCNCGTSSAS